MKLTIGRIWCVLVVLAFTGCGGGMATPDAGGPGGGSAGGGAAGGAAGGTVTEGPSLLGTVPSDGSTGASATGGLSLQFSRAVTRSSVAVSITPAVALGEPTLEAEGTEVRFPAPGLLPGVSYVVTVTAADADGRALVGPGTFRFTTAAQVDSMAPTLQ